MYVCERGTEMVLLELLENFALKIYKIERIPPIHWLCFEIVLNA